MDVTSKIPDSHSLAAALFAVLLTLLTSLLLGSCASPALNGKLPPQVPWSKLATPSLGIPRSIGSPSAGCIAGATSLPPDGAGFQVMRLTRRRFYGHPSLISFLRKYGGELDLSKLGPILIGDIGQPRGGPMLSGHQSHQTGLDVDLWFWHPAHDRRTELKPLTLDEREQLQAPSVTEALTPEIVQFLKIAAEFTEVDRIFVHPKIKKYLCEKSQNFPKRDWLHKLRPWWGHEDHFHVRLNCPFDSPECIPTGTIPEGSGCDSTLDWWFTAEAALPPQLPPGQKPKELVLPQSCQDVGES